MLFIIGRILIQKWVKLGTLSQKANILNRLTNVYQELLWLFNT